MSRLTVELTSLNIVQSDSLNPPALRGYPLSKQKEYNIFIIPNSGSMLMCYNVYLFSLVVKHDGFNDLNKLR
jgi:hypothetical protein